MGPGLDYFRNQSETLWLLSHPIADTHSFIRQVGDKSGWLSSSHAELGLGVPGKALSPHT
jgi:hypothetical protein